MKGSVQTVQSPDRLSGVQVRSVIESFVNQVRFKTETAWESRPKKALIQDQD